VISFPAPAFRPRCRSEANILVGRCSPPEPETKSRGSWKSRVDREWMQQHHPFRSLCCSHSGRPEGKRDRDREERAEEH
jgi:hypothetical protein